MHKARNISSMFFVKNNLVTAFPSSECWGILNIKGQALSEKGGVPSCYHTLEIAKELALYCHGFTGHSWVDVYSTGKEAKNSLETKPLRGCIT